MSSSTKAFAFETEFSKEGDVLNEGLQSYRRYKQNEVDELVANARDEALRSVEAETERRMAATAEAIVQHLQPLLPFAVQIADQMRKEASELAVQLAKKLAGAALEHVPEAAVEAGLSEILSSLPNGPRLVLKVDAEIADRVSAAIQARLPADSEFHIEPTQGGAPGSWKLSWDQGAFSHDPEQLAETLEALIAEHMNQPIDAQGDLFAGVA